MYREYGWTSESAQSTSFIYDKLVAMLSKEKNKCILDMGCGNGDIANRLIAEGYCVYGVDASEQGVAIANRITPNHFFVMDFDRGRFPEELSQVQFDTIISTEVIEHLYSPETYIKQCARYLGKGGILIISTPYHGYLKNVILAVSGKLDAHFTALWEGGHIKFWSRKTLNILLERNQFSVKMFKGCGRWPYVWKSMLVQAEKQAAAEADF